MKIVYGIILLAAIALIAVAALLPTTTSTVQSEASNYTFKIVQTYPHDPQAFSQGLIFRDGFLYESTGLYGQSSLRKVELKTGTVLRQVPIDANIFAEGLTDWQDRLVQLTWKGGAALTYTLTDFTALAKLSYRGEGWGLTHDSKQLILSDGSEMLRFFDPQTMRETGQVPVHDGLQIIRELNELEFVKGSVWANVWHTDRIAMIAPDTGRITGWIDLTGLLPISERSDPEAVPNGIAYDAAGDRIFVTGKLWPKLFEIQIVPKP